MFQPYPYSYWQYHLTIFAIFISKWFKYPILGSKTNRGDIRLYFKTYEKNRQMAPLLKYLTFKSKNQDISTSCTLPRD